MSHFVKCKWYRPTDGTPLHGGCKIQSCKFIHPTDPSFERAEDARRLVRCKYFDDEGRSIPPGCFNSSGACAFVHPDSLEWNFSRGEPSRSTRSVRAPISAPAVNPKVSTPGQASPLLLTNTKLQPPRGSPTLIRTFGAPFLDNFQSPQTTTAATANVSDQSTLPNSEKSEKSGGITAPFGSINGLGKNHTVRSTATIGATASTAVVLQNAENDASWMWKKRLNTLSRAIDISNQLSEIDSSIAVRRNLLSLTIDSNPTSGIEKDLEEYESSAKEKRKALGLELEKGDSRLSELGFWSVPITMNPPESIDPLDLAQLLKRLNALETRFSSFIDSRQGLDNAMSYHVDGGTSNDAVEESTTENISERLNYLHIRINQLETEVAHDRMIERLNEVVEDKILDKLGPSEQTMQEVALNQGMPNAIVKRMDEDLTQLCNDLLDSAPVDVLESKIKYLSSETEVVRGDVSLLLEEHRLLDRRQSNVDMQTELMLQELNELKAMTLIKTTQEDARRTVLNEIMSVVHKRVGDELAEIQSTMKQTFGTIETTMLADLEPTVAQTSIIYKRIASDLPP